MQLKDSQCDRVLTALRRIIRSIDLHSRRLAQQHSLTGPQLILMQAIDRSGEISTGELARSVSLSHATVTGILDRLQKRGLVVRRRSDSDKRKVMVKLHDSGRLLLEKAPSPLQERFVREFGELAEWEQTQILSSLQRIAFIMDADDVDAAPVLTSGSLTQTETEVVETLSEGSGQPPPSAGAASPSVLRGNKP